MIHSTRWEDNSIRTLLLTLVHPSQPGVLFLFVALHECPSALCLRWMNPFECVCVCVCSVKSLPLIPVFVCQSWEGEFYKRRTDIETIQSQQTQCSPWLVWRAGQFLVRVDWWLGEREADATISQTRFRLSNPRRRVPVVRSKTVQSIKASNGMDGTVRWPACRWRTTSAATAAARVRAWRSSLMRHPVFTLDVKLIWLIWLHSLVPYEITLEKGIPVHHRQL